MALGLLLPAAPTKIPTHAQGGDDLAFYRAVVARVRAGQPYEAAAVAQLHAVKGPLRPFLVVRPPALATMLAWLPDPRWGDMIMMLTSVAVIGGWGVRFRQLEWPPLGVAAAAVCVFTGVAAPMASQGMGLVHDAWAGLLIALSLAARTERRFAAAVAFGLMAALIRELALPYLLVMAFAALIERRRLEAGAFAAALGVALAALAWHAHAVIALTSSHDLHSPGWVKFGGWRFVMATVKWNLFVILGGGAAAAALVPLAAAGAIGRNDGLGLRLAMLIVGYTVGFMAIGRPENGYWGLVTVPVLAVALCFTPAALGDLWRQAQPRRDNPAHS
jgi:hypothetical protein